MDIGNPDRKDTRCKEKVYINWNVFKHPFENTEPGPVIHHVDSMEVAEDKLTKDIQVALAAVQVSRTYNAPIYMNIPPSQKIRNKNRFL